jgi:predicted ATPase
MNNWIGREREVNDIYQLIGPGDGVLVSGGRGSGKTTVARLVADRFARESNRAVTWIGADSPDATSIFESALTRTPQGHLIVVDGLDEAPDGGHALSRFLRHGLMQREYLYVLATAHLERGLQGEQGLNGFYRYDLPPMQDDELQELVQHLTGQTETPPTELLRFVEGNPLAACLLATLVDLI